MCRPVSLPKNRRCFVMGPDKSFLRTCLLPMGASMEPRYNDQEHSGEPKGAQQSYSISTQLDEEFGGSLYCCNLFVDEEACSQAWNENSPAESFLAPNHLGLLMAVVIALTIFLHEHPFKIVQPIATLELTFEQPSDSSNQNKNDTSALNPRRSTITRIIGALETTGPCFYHYNPGILQWEQIGEDLEHWSTPQEGGATGVALSGDGRPLNPVEPPNHWQPTLPPPAQHPRYPPLPHFSSYESIPMTHVYDLMESEYEEFHDSQ